MRVVRAEYTAITQRACGSTHAMGQCYVYVFRRRDPATTLVGTTRRVCSALARVNAQHASVTPKRRALLRYHVRVVLAVDDARGISARRVARYLRRCAVPEHEAVRLALTLRPAARRTDVTNDVYDGVDFSVQRAK